jgi:hypothetical protein
MTWNRLTLPIQHPMLAFISYLYKSIPDAYRFVKSLRRNSARQVLHLSR